jgi:DnaJ like chaperone protein
MLDKYRHESKQTLCIIGVLVLSAKLCKADGHFSIQEEEEILKIIPHEPQQKRILLKILEEAAKDSNPIEHDASRIKTLIGEEHSDFLEFILAVLVRLAKSDHVYSEEEERDIRKIAEAFNIKKTLYEKMLIKIRLFFQSILTVFKKQNA